jgi:hypothetical protein
VTGTSWKIYSSIWRRDSIRSAGTEEIIECVKLRLQTDSYIGEFQRGVTGPAVIILATASCSLYVLARYS